MNIERNEEEHTQNKFQRSLEAEDGTRWQNQLLAWLLQTLYQGRLGDGCEESGKSSAKIAKKPDEGRLLPLQMANNFHIRGFMP